MGQLFNQVSFAYKQSTWFCQSNIKPVKPGIGNSRMKMTEQYCRNPHLAKEQNNRI